MRTVSTDDAPAPAGCYAQGVVSRGLVFVSGQLPVVPGAKPDASLYGGEGGVSRQTICCLQNCAAIVRAAGGSPRTFVKVTVFVSDALVWDEVNTAYEAWMGEHASGHRPARVVVPVNGPLHYGFDVEIEVVAEVLGEP